MTSHDLKSLEAEPFQSCPELCWAWSGRRWQSTSRGTAQYAGESLLVKEPAQGWLESPLQSGARKADIACTSTTSGASEDQSGGTTDTRGQEGQHREAQAADQARCQDRGPARMKDTNI